MNNKLLRELARGYTICGRNVPLLKFLFVNFFASHPARFTYPLIFASLNVADCPGRYRIYRCLQCPRCIR